MKPLIAVGIIVTILLATENAGAAPTPAWGIRGGASSSPNHAYLGFQTEFGRILGGAHLAPSLDLGLSDGSATILNGDLRWYLVTLPETGLQFYGAAGPGLVISPDTNLGLQLTAGLHIPMRNGRRYNVEARFGFGDVPDFKFGGSVLFSF
jgi:hypothetical protein